MTLELASVMLDVDAMENGGWVDGIPAMGDLRVHVRSLESRAAKAAFERLARERVRKFHRAGIPDGVADTVAEMHREDDLGIVLLEVVLLGWENLAEDGRAIAFDPDEARRLICMPIYRTFRAAVVWAANAVGKPARLRELA